MATTFAAGQTINLSLDGNDTITWVGSGNMTVTPASGPSWAVHLEGSQTYGPFGQAVSVSIVTVTNGNYTVNGGSFPVVANESPLTGVIGNLVPGYDTIPFFNDGSVSTIQTGDIYIDQIDSAGLTLPNPYPAQANAPVHPSVLFFPQCWNGARYWISYTPYPGSDSQYENPCVASSNDGLTWTAKGSQPLIGKPTSGYNADTHLFMSPDGLTMYLAFRERIIGGNNSVKVMESTDGVNWSSPVTILSGVQGTEDFGSPSIWWNGTGWTCISHNLDASSPYPVRRNVSATSDIYGSWGAASTVTVPAFGTRQWWHSFHVRLSSGQIVALFQDNTSAGAAGFIYWAESADDGATYSITGHAMAGAPIRAYRSAFALRNAPSGVEIDIFLDDLQGYKIFKHTARLGANKLRKDVLARIASYIASASAPAPDVTWADNFTRADSAASLGTAASGGTYTASSGTWGISSNRAYPVSNGRVLAASGSANHEVSARFVSFTSGVQQWLICRAVDGSNYWRCGCSSPNAAGQSILVLQSIVSGVVSVNKEIGVLAAGDVLTLRAHGVTLEVLVNGIKQWSEVMATDLTGSSFGMQANTGATTFMDNLTCATL